MYRKKNSIQLLVAILIGFAGAVGTLLLLSQGVSARPMLDEDNLTISKSQSSDYAHPGEQLVYTLTYHSTSTDTVNGIIITDTLDPNVSYAAASPAPAGGLPDTPYWSLDPLSASMSGTIVLTVTITSPLASGTIITNSATIDGDHTNLKTIEVTATVETATSVTLAPATASITAGQPIPYTLTAHGSYGEWDVTESGIYTTTPGAGGSWVENVYTAATAGPWIVTGTYDTYSDTAVLTVTHANVTDLTLAPATATITAGQPIPYTLTASDAFGNNWDVTSDAAYTITSGAGGTWVTNVYTAQVAGSWTVTGAFDSLADTAILTVTNAAPTIENVTYSTPANEGSPTTITVTAYDPENNTLTYGFDWDGNGIFTDTGDISDQSSNQADHTWDDDGLYTITIQVSDGSNTVTDTVAITVTNLPPTITDVSNNGPVGEGSPATISITATDPGDDTLSYAYDWNKDNDFDDGGEGDNSHTWYDEGIHTITVQVNDGDGGIVTGTTTITVVNVPPTVNAGYNQTVDEGDTVNFSGSFTDPGSGDTHTILWDLGDGVTTTATLSPYHVYADDGIYTVTLTVTDNDGGTGDDTLTVTVNNVAPTVDAGHDRTVDEGDTVDFIGSFTDPGADDTHTILWYFGDGTTASGTLTPSHIYADNDLFLVTLVVEDDDGGMDVDILRVTVNNVTPTVEAGSDQTADEGETVNFSGSFDDPGSGDTHTILWNFGDGATASGVLSPSHIYTDDGVYTVTLTVTDDDDGTGDDTLIVTVNNVDPIVNAGPDQRVVSEGATVNFSGSFDDPGAGDTHTILWDFGDGASASGDLTPTHVYTEPASIAVTLTITDDDGGVGSDVMMVTVENLPPNADAGGPYTGIAGLPVTMTASASQDPGGGSLTYDWDLDGDGEYGDASEATVTYSWTVAGVHTVTVQVADAQQAIDADSAQVSINPIDLNHIILTPPTATIFAWETRAYTVEAFDVYNNSRGDVTGQTAFSIVESGHGGHWTGNVYNPQNLGDWTVQAVYTETSVTTDTASLTVLSPVMHIEKEGVPDIVEAGAIIAYTLTYSNTGNLEATGVVVTDTPSPNILFTWADPEPDGGTPNAPYWNIGSLAPDEQGQIHVTATVARPLPNGTVLTNTAWLDADHVAPLSATQQTIVTSRPVLTITKASRPDPVVVGQNLVYTIIITNSGNENASSVTITEDYDPNTSFVYASTPPDPGSENREWTFATLAVDHSIGIDVIVRVTNTLPVGTVLTNVVTLDSDQTTPISATEVTQVLSESILEITQMDNPDPVPAGDGLVYIVHCENTGSAPAMGVVLTATYDSRVTYIDATPDPDVGDNVWSNDQLNPGQSWYIMMEVDVDTPLPNGSVLANMVTIDSNGTAPASFIETTVVTSSPDLAFSVAQQPESTVDAGAPLMYTLHYTNTGNANGTEAVITATFDNFAPFSSSTPPPTGGAGNVRYWEIGNIVGVNNDGEVNGVGEIVIQTDVTLPLTNGTTLNFAAQLEDAEGDFLEDTAQIAVTSAPILSLDKSDGVSTVYAGDVLTYTITYTNSGNENAYNVFITDTLPVSYTQYITCGIAGGTCLMNDGEVIFYIPTIVAPTSGQAQVTLQVDDPLPSGADLVTNRVTMTHPSLAAPIDAQDVDLIGTLPDLTVDVTHSHSLFSPGKLMEYTVTYGNAGHMHTQDVVITTTLPLDTIYEDYGWTSSDGQTYTYVIGDLPAGDTGNTITFTVKYPDSEPQQIRASEFDTPFTIAETGSAGGDTNPDDNSTDAYIGVPDLVVLDFTISPLPLEPNVPVTFTIVMKNQGTGRAENPASGGGSTLDIFTSLVESYPWERYGPIWDYIPPLAPGTDCTHIVSVNNPFDQEIIQFSEQEIQEIVEFYVRVDSHADHPYGLVPEFNEMNNLGGPVDPRPSDYSIYLPLVTRQ